MDVQSRVKRIARFLTWWVAGFLSLALLTGVPARASSGDDNTVSIESIIPDPASWAILVQFNQAAPLNKLQHRLAILPRIKIDWDNCRQVSGRSVVLKAEFKGGERHLLTFPQGFKINDRTYQKKVNSFIMPDRPARAEFLDQRSVIEKESPQRLHLKVVNVERLTFDSLSVPPVLLPLALAASRRPGNGSLAEIKADLERAAQEAAALSPKVFKDLMAEPAAQRQLFAAPGQKNQVRAFSIPLTFRPENKKGSLELINISAEDAHNRLIKGTPRLFRITDLGLSYKLSARELLVWATSLQTGLPREKVSLFGFTKNMEVFPLGRTDRFGILAFQPSSAKGLSLKTLGRFEEVELTPALNNLTHVAAVTEGDVSYIEIRPQGNISPEDIHQARRGREKEKALRGHLFTERGVYRPGDTVHFKGTIRQYRDQEITTPEAGSAQVTIVDSKNAKILDQNLPLSEFGTLWGQLELKPYFPLGTYTLTLRYGEGEGQEINRTFQVQEFRPPRHYAEIGFEKFQRWDESIPDRPRLEHLVKINIKGLYYAGGQVKHGRVRYKILQSSTTYQALGYDDYSFGFSADDQEQVLESGESMLDEKGEMVVEFPLDLDNLNGRYGLKVTASVIDFDGRTSGTSKSFKVEPDYLVGIGPLPPRIRAGVGQSLDLVVLGRGGQRVRHGKLRAEILQESGAYVRKRNQEGDLYWEYQRLWRRFQGDELDLLNGEARYKFDLTWGGGYVISATFQDENGREFVSAVPVSAEGDIHWDDYSNRDKPFETLDLVSDREVYEPGQTATVYIQPRQKIARYLVTLEQDKVISHRVMEAQPGARSLDIPIKKDYAPNVFVSVLALCPRGAFPGRPLAYDQEAPSFVFGTINLPVRPKVQDLVVELGGEAGELKAEPGAKISLEIKTHRTAPAGPARPVRAEMALAVVDESVLALTAFKTPALESLVEFDLPLAVFTGELRALLLHQTPFAPVLNRELTGGGGLAGSEELETRKYFNPVAYFNPSVVTDQEGLARVEFTLPDTITRYRIYAVACDQGSSFASAERDLVAVKDFYVEPGLPRFLTKGDKFSFSVKGFNTTAQAGSMNLELESSGNLKLGSPLGAVDLPPQSSQTAPVSGKVLRAGAAWTLFRARMNGYKDAVKTELPVLSGNILSREALLGSFRNRAEAAYSIPPGLAGVDWSAQGTEEVEVLLTLSGSPFLQMSKGLRYLLRYPYGCVEQTSSGIMPLAAMRGLINQGLIPDITVKDTDAYLKQGLNRLLLMQTAGGGFGYWPGYMQPHAWGSVYAAFALTTAQASGIKIDSSKLVSLIKYLKSTIKKGPRSEVFRAMVAYVLALNKSLDKSILSQVGQDFDNQSYEARLFLVLALAESGLGEMNKIVSWTREVLAHGEAGNRADEFQARYRGPAVALLAASRILGQDPLTDRAALRLLAGLGGQGIWSSTSDTGWALFALGEYFKNKEFSPEAVQVRVGLPDGTEKTVEIQPKGHQTLSLDSEAFLKNPVIKLQARSGTDLLYLLSVTLPRPDYAREGSKDGFEVTKTIENTDGGEKIKVGDLVKVKVRLEPRSRTNSYIMLDDPLPAGLVAINSALKTEENVGGSSLAPSDEYVFWYLTDEGIYRFVPNFFEIRDERVLAFRDRLWSGTYEFSYYARAVCAGEFVVPPTKVELMYSPEVRGYTPASSLLIEER